MAGAAQAQFYDPEPYQEEVSEVVGWHPTFCEEQNFHAAPTLLGSLPNPEPEDWATVADDNAVGEERREWHAADAFLAPMVPGEAVWVQRGSAGEFRESVHVGLPFSVSRQKRRVDAFYGPLAVDFVSLGTLAYYSQLSGPGADRFEDDGYLGALTLSTALMWQVTDSAVLRLQTSLYYLYTENRLGFYFGNGSTTAAEFSYRTSIGNWDLRLSDVFKVYFPLSDLLDEVQVDEIAIAGRYRLGRREFESANPFSDRNVYFINTVGLEAATWLSENLRLKLHGRHWDAWQSTSLVHRADVNNLGAGLFYDSPDLWFMPWLMYDWYDMNESKWNVHHARAGLTLPFSRTLHAYARAAYIWMEAEDGRSFERPGGDIGIVHQINRGLSHSLFGGYNFLVDEIGEPFLGSYWRYSIRWAPVGSRYVLSGFVQQNHDDLSDREASVLGARVDARLTAKTRLMVSTAVTKSDYAMSDYESRVLRVSLSQQLTRKLQGSLTWQFADYDLAGNHLDFDEQLVMLDLLWTL